MVIHHTLPGWGLLACAFSMLAACGHGHQTRGSDLHARAAEYVESQEARPGDPRIIALRAFATSFADALEADRTDTQAFMEKAEMLNASQACLYGSYGHLAQHHQRELQRLLVGEMGRDPHYISLLHAMQEIPAFKGDACSY